MRSPQVTIWVRQKSTAILRKLYQLSRFSAAVQTTSLESKSVRPYIIAKNLWCHRGHSNAVTVTYPPSIACRCCSAIFLKNNRMMTPVMKPTVRYAAKHVCTNMEFGPFQVTAMVWKVKWPTSLHKGGTGVVVLLNDHLEILIKSTVFLSYWKVAIIIPLHRKRLVHDPFH